MYGDRETPTLVESRSHSGDRCEGKGVMVILLPSESTGSIYATGKDPNYPQANRNRATHQGGEEKMTALTKALVTSVTCPSPARSRKTSRG